MSGFSPDNEQTQKINYAKDEDLLKLAHMEKCPDPECSGFMDWFWLDGKDKYMCDLEARHTGACKLENVEALIRQRQAKLAREKAETPKAARYAATALMVALGVFVLLLIVGGCVAIIHGF